MAYYLTAGDQADGERRAEIVVQDAAGDEMADLKIFWGPEICRLEYLLHLLDTGRIIDESSAKSA